MGAQKALLAIRSLSVTLLLREPGRPRARIPTLTEQVSAGDAPLRDGGFHGTDGGGEDVGLLKDLGQLWAVQGAEGSGIVLLRPLVELQGCELIAPSLGVPVLVLQGYGAAAQGQLQWGLYTGRHFSNWLQIQGGTEPRGHPQFPSCFLS